MSSSKNNLHRLVKLFYPHKVKVFFALLSLVTTVLAILFYGSLAKDFINGLAVDGMGNVSWFFASFVFLTVILAISGYFRSFLINDVSLLVADDLRRKVFARVLKFPMTFFDNKSSGDVFSRISSDISEIFSVLSKNVSFFLRNLLLLAGSIVFLVKISPDLFGLMMLVILLSLLPIFYLAKKLRSISSTSKEQNSLLSSFVKESLHFVKIIKSFNGEVKSGNDFAKLSDEALVNDRKRSVFLALLVSVAIFFAFFAVALMLYLGSVDVLSGELSGGDFSSFVFYSVILSIALVGLAQSFSQILSISQNSKRVFELFDLNVEGHDFGENVGKLDEKYIIEFKDVDFAYPCKKENLVLKDFSFKIKNGEKVVIIGESGSGKSSIFSLLFKFYDVDDGVILINGKGVDEYSLNSLREVFSYVMQDNFIFSGTIYENITYPHANFTKDQISQIVDSNPAFEFVSDLKEGVDSFVGNMGSKLSGGQKQRIAILRSVLSDSEVLIFDEATSALDEKNEQLMIDLINEFAPQKTVIFVSHREIKGVKFDQKIKL